ncbi:MAG: DUF2550 domain-containing protein [Actinomycetaceae bacterium]|nr:DUF2550 domain-containing protein [Actinomycetaceae bacterium]
MSGNNSWALFALLIFLICVAIGGWARMRWLLHRSGSFECMVRLAGEHRWRQSVFVLQPYEVQWFSSFSFFPTPRGKVARQDFCIDQTIDIDSPHSCLRIVFGDQRMDVVMEADACSALVSWIDSAPPVEEPV